MNSWRILTGDVREKLSELPAGCVRTCVTSPPYWGLRDYGVSGQLGLESTPEAYVAAIVAVFAAVRRVLADDGTVWLNLGDSYAHSLRQSQNKAGDKQNTNEGSIRRGFAPNLTGCKEKDLVGIPWMVAFALRADGWYLRSDIIWSKPNPMPESVTDRPTKAHEYIFLLSKSRSYYYDAAAIREPYALSTVREFQEDYTGTARKDYKGTGAQNPSSVKARIISNAKRRTDDGADLSLPLPVADSMDSSKGRMARQVLLVDDNRRQVDSRKRAQACGPHKQQSSAVSERSHTDPSYYANGGANKRSVWNVATQPYPDAHFATFPEALIVPCILAGSAIGDTVLDPFAGSGTTGAVAIRHQRNFIGCELNPAYVQLARKRIGNVAPMFAQEVA